MRLPKIPRDNRPLREALIVGAVSVAGAATFFSAAFASTWWARAIAVMLASLTAIQIVLIFHDAMHESLFRSHHANRWVGRMIGAFYLTPYHFLQWSHLQHHQHAGRIEGDTELLHYTRAVARTRRFGSFLAGLARFPLAPVLFAPALQLSHALGLFAISASRRRRLLRDSVLDLALMVAVWTPLALALHAHGVLQAAMIFGFLCPFAVSMSLVYLAASPLHTGMASGSVAERPVAERAFFVSRTVEVSWLGRLVFCNLSYHLEHHLYSHLPRWQLGAAAGVVRPALVRFAKAHALPLVIHPSYARYYVESFARVSRFNDIAPHAVADANACFTLVRSSCA